MTPIPGFPGYAITSDGAVWSHASGSAWRLSTRKNDSGYLVVTLSTPDGRRVKRGVHILVLETFVGPRPSPKHHGAHGPGGQHDNSVENLRWALPHENEADKPAKRRFGPG